MARTSSPRRWTWRACASGSAWCSRSPRHFPMSIFDNVAFGLRLSRRITRSELDRPGRGGAAGCGDVGRGEGQAARGRPRPVRRPAAAPVHCAHAGAAPEVILFDEPTAALDPISTLRVEETLQSLRERYCIAIVTHNLQQAARVSNITAFMYLGDLVEIGPTEQIFTAPRTAARMTTSPDVSADPRHERDARHPILPGAACAADGRCRRGCDRGIPGRARGRRGARRAPAQAQWPPRQRWPPPRRARPVSAEPAPSGPPVFHCKDVSMFYGAKQALKNITLDVAPRQVLAMIGPSGCGKSTFLRCLNRMNDTIAGPRITGTITLDGAGHLRPAVGCGAAARAHRHGVPEAQPVPEVDLRQRRLRPAHPRHDAQPRASSMTWSARA